MSQRRTALGRGLGALIANPPPVPAEDSETHYRVDTKMRTPEPEPAVTGPQTLDIALIDPNPEQPRREFEAAALRQLADSIGQHGVLQPVVVRRAGERYELVMGERRFRASQLAGREVIPAVVLDVDPADRLELAIVENVQRQDLNPIELAHAYQALGDSGMTQDEIGRKVSMDRSSVANHIRLLDLSRGIQADVEGGRIKMGHAKALLQLTDLEAREALHAQILKDSLSVRATEAAARSIAGGRAPSKRTRKPLHDAAPSLDADTRAYVERIERHLQTRVTLHPGNDGRGKLEIRYFNLEDLERIGGLLLGERP
jgi:ParB family chromosome partitioning protein